MTTMDKTSIDNNERYVPIYIDTLNQVSSTQDISIKDLLKIIIKGKWVIGGAILLTTLLAVTWSLSLPNIYTSEALLSPVSAESQGGLDALAGGLGGLASFAGVNIGSGSVDKTKVALQVLTSRKFIGRFIEKYDLLVPLIAVESWDLESDKLVINDSFYDTQSGTWVREVNLPKKAIPSIQEAYKAFKEILLVNEDNDSGMITVAIEYFSPVLAQKWVELLVFELNQVMMNTDVKDAEQSISFLKEQISKTDISELKVGLFELVEEQTKTLMLASARDEYVFRTIDPALVPELKSKPQRALFVILGFILGGILGLTIVIVRHLNFE